MLRKTVGALLLCAIVLNIGAGILYNGVPNQIKRLIPSLDDEDPVVLSVEVPVSRAGDVYITSYNMTLDLERTSEEEKKDFGTFHQSGTMTRSLNVEETIMDLSGMQSMRYHSGDTGEIEILGDLSMHRRIFLDEEQGTMSEERSTVIETTGFLGATPQVSKIDVTMRNARMSWEELLWRSMVPDNRTFTNGTSGSFTGRISMEEIGVLLPDANLVWNVVRTWNQQASTRSLVQVSDTGSGDIGLTFSVIFSDKSPIPIFMSMSASGSYPTEEGTVDVKLEMERNLLDIYLGSGTEISWSIDQGSLGGAVPVSEAMDGMVISEGDDTAFWASPSDCLDTAMEEGVMVDEFIESYGPESISMSSSSYYKNESGMAGSRIWNVTLAGPSNGIKAPACSFEVMVQTVGSGVLERRKMSLISEVRHSILISPDPSRSIISLSTFQSILEGSEHNDDFFISSQFSPDMVLDTINRGDGGSGPLSTMIFNLLGINREHARDLFICHVPDPSDPTRYYVVAVDGTQGRMISETEISGSGTLFLNSFGIDLA